MPPPDASLPPELPREAAGFRLKRELGRGGMGVVYEAEEIVSGRRVALKVLLADLAVSEQAYERFQREARLAAAISHVHCVFVYGAHQVEGSPAIAMEIVDGETLEAKVARKEVIPIQTAVRWAIDLIDGLEAAHQAGILHRDVKPSNCFVTTEGRVKIGDFGLSRTLQLDAQLTQTGQFLGSPLYASPEQARGRTLDVRSDLYSCGATLYAVLTGRAPYSGSNVGEVLARILSEAPDPPSSIRPAIPKALESVVLRAMERDPEERYRDLAEFREALAPFATTASGTASPWKRIGAYLLDSAVLSLVSSGLIVLQSFFDVDFFAKSANPRDPQALWLNLFMSVMTLAYFMVGEGRFGTTLGKWLLGLRVVATASREPSLGRAALRNVLFQGPRLLAYFAAFMLATSDQQLAIWTSLAPLVLFGVTFSSARRSNMWRGLHEFGSGTLVIPVPAPFQLARPKAPPPEFELSARGDLPDRVGAYAIEGVVGSTMNGRLLKARDSTLERSVWIHLPADTRTVADETRRSLSRPTRLRWLDSVRTADGIGDVFESPGGTSLPIFAARHPQLEWWRAQQLLASLVQELRADSHGPRQYALEQLWIDRNWNLRLLDEPVGHAPFRTYTAMALVREAACALWQGGCGKAPQLPRDLPTHAEETVTKLLSDKRSFANLEEIGSALERLEFGPAAVTLRSRAAQLAVSSVLPVVFALFVLLILVLVNPLIRKTNQAGRYLEQLTANEAARLTGNVPLILTDEERDAREVLVVDALIDNSRSGVKLTLDEPEREMLERARVKHGQPTAESVAQAEAFIAKEIARTETAGNYNLLDHPYLMGAGLAFGLSALWGVFALGFAFVLRGGLTLSIFGIRVRGRSGRHAGRWLCLLRTTLAWLPVFATAAAGFMLIWADLVAAGATVGAIGIALWLAAIVHGMTNPAQSIVDRLLGTRLVPR